MSTSDDIKNVKINTLIIFDIFSNNTNINRTSLDKLINENEIIINNLIQTPNKDTEQTQQTNIYQQSEKFILINASTKDNIKENIITPLKRILDILKYRKEYLLDKLLFNYNKSNELLDKLLDTYNQLNEMKVKDIVLIINLLSEIQNTVTNTVVVDDKKIIESDNTDINNHLGVTNLSVKEHMEVIYNYIDMINGYITTMSNLETTSKEKENSSQITSSTSESKKVDVVQILNNLTEQLKILYLIIDLINSQTTETLNSYLLKYRDMFILFKSLFDDFINFSDDKESKINSINVDKFINEKRNKINQKKRIDEINKYNNNYELKVSLINIDSRFRNKTPLNIINNTILLEDNPIVVEQNSDIIKIKYRNVNKIFNIGDNIIIENVKGKTMNLINPLYLINNFEYAIVKYDDHKIPFDFNTTVDSIKVKLTNLNNDSIYFIANIPFNLLKGLKNFVHFRSVTIETAIFNDIKTTLNIIRDSELYDNYFLIELPNKYVSDNNTNINLDVNYKIEFLNIGGIPLYYINSNYPINYQRYQDNLEIKDIDNEFIYIQTSIKGVFTEQSGGKNNKMGIILDSIEGYPNANKYTVQLKNNLTNVVRIELLTTEIPFIDFIVKNNINFKNNKLYWKNISDGDTLYSIELLEGNYEPETLISTIQTKMNLVERYNSTSEQKVFNIFETSINTNTNEVIFKSFIFKLLPNSLSAGVITINNDEYIKITINHPNNQVEINDEITIRNSENLSDLSSTVINTKHFVYEVNNLKSTYSFLILKSDETILDVSGNGGINLSIRTKTLSQLLFNFNDTLGHILGFKDVGKTNAITEFKHIISNLDPYIESIKFNEVGDEILNNNIINLTGSNNYLLMYLNEFDGIESSTSNTNPFSKILLSGTPGEYMFNTFINSPLEFDFPISSLNELDISFQYSDGTSPDFRNFDHSFTLRVTQIVYKPYGTNLNSNNKTYLNTMIDNQYLE